MTLPRFQSQDPRAQAFFAALDKHKDELARVFIWGARSDGTDLHIRYEPSRAINYVQVHWQSTATGGAAYNASTSVSSTEVDCRETRLRDASQATAVGMKVWLIPVLKDDSGTAYKLDGQGGRPDYMSFHDFGV